MKNTRLVALLGALFFVVACACNPLPFFDSDEPAREVSPAPGWTDCSGEKLGRLPNGFGFECRKVEVPQNWSKPDDGHTFKISVLRARATDQRNRIGSLLINPGGPGASGVDTALYLTQGLPTEITRRFDIVGFDPRGVARSEGVRCFSDADMDVSFSAEPDPVSQTEFDEIVAMSRKMGKDCGDKYGAKLPLFSTEQAARDMDKIREALGDKKLTYLGYSYGTLLGATYAQLFPQNVRAFVLDGAVDPTLSSEGSAEGQAKGFELAFNNFAAWCANNAGRCNIDGDARAVVTKLMDDARNNPKPGRGGRKTTAGWILWGIVSSLYSEARWPDLGSALHDLQKGRTDTIFRLADSYTDRSSDGKYTGLFDSFAAVNCTDDGKPASIERIRSLQSEWRLKYPLFGAPLATGMLSCAVWPGTRDPYPTGRAVGAPPIVVIGTKGDPATPYEQTPALAQMLGVGVVLTWDGEGHTAYPETRCVTAAVNKYLLDLQTPAEGTVCPAK